MRTPELQRYHDELEPLVEELCLRARSLGMRAEVTVEYDVAGNPLDDGKATSWSYGRVYPTQEASNG